MALLDRVKLRTGSDLPDSELQAMIDAITADMDARFGPAGPISVELGDPTDPCSRALRTLRLVRPLDDSQPVEIVEIDPSNSGLPDNEIQLAASDYAVLHGGRTLQRLTGGPNGRSFWAPMVRATYTPAGEQAARDEAVIKLMQLDLSYRGGLKSERAGDYQYTLSGDVAAEREAIFGALAQRRGTVMA
ncbi:hypothetical protein SAMN02927924_01691 [Sphingobium faniae]|nr:hypothetical protein SAMN02927924_01691 [Sphingobium faniae]